MVKGLKVLDVVGIGTPVVDCFATITDDFLKSRGLRKGATNFLPRAELDALEGAVKVKHVLPGDNARNVCEGISMLNGSAAYGGCVGKDWEGRFFCRTLEMLEIHSEVVFERGRTGKILVLLTPDKERTFAVDLGNSTQYRRVARKVLRRTRFLYLTSITALTSGSLRRTALTWMEQVLESGGRIALSLESPPMIRKHKQEIVRLIDQTHILFANKVEYRSLGMSIETIRRKVECFFLKMGKQGSKVVWGRSTARIPCLSKRVVDTTGAGDYYAAGALHGLARGLSPEKAGVRGAELAAKIVARTGASFCGLAPKGKRSNRSF